MSGMLDRIRARHETELRVTRRVVRHDIADKAGLPSIARFDVDRTGASDL